MHVTVTDSLVYASSIYTQHAVMELPVDGWLGCSAWKDSRGSVYSHLLWPLKNQSLSQRQGQGGCCFSYQWAGPIHCLCLATSSVWQSLNKACGLCPQIVYLWHEWIYLCRTNCKIMQHSWRKSTPDVMGNNPIQRETSARSVKEFMLSFTGAILFLVCLCSRNSQACHITMAVRLAWVVMSIKHRVDSGFKTLRHGEGWFRKPKMWSNISMWAIVLRCSYPELKGV